MNVNSKVFFLIISIILINSLSCGSRKVVLPETDWDTVIRQSTGKVTYLGLSDVMYPCTITGLQSDVLRIQHDSVTLTIPSAVISKVRIDTGGRGQGYRIAGALIGGAIGATAGYLVGKKLADSTGSAIGHPVSVGLIIGGTIGGAWLGGGRKTELYYPFTTNVSRYTLHEEVGEDILRAEIKMYDLFEDLPQANEEILLMQILKFGEGRYLLLYDLKTGDTLDVRWKEADTAYLERQHQKISEKLK